jgi:hypothetical protein
VATGPIVLFESILWALTYCSQEGPERVPSTNWAESTWQVMTEGSLGIIDAAERAPARRIELVLQVWLDTYSFPMRYAVH